MPPSVFQMMVTSWSTWWRTQFPIFRTTQDKFLKYQIFWSEKAQQAVLITAADFTSII